MSSRNASAASARIEGLRAFARRDWSAIESETLRARKLAFRIAGPEAHHSMYMELSEAILERRGKRSGQARDSAYLLEDMETHLRLQQAFQRLARR